MNEEVHTLRRRLQDLHDGHLTGFVGDAQFAEGRALLERQLIDAVMTQANAEAPAATPAPAPATHAEDALLKPHPSPTRWPLWAGAGGAAALCLVALAGWWAATAPPSGAAVGVLPDAARAASAVGAAPPVALPVEQAAVLHADSPTAVPAPTGAASSGGSISGTVALAPALAGRASPNDTLFVYARALGGPPVPLAVIRKQVKDLPMAFTLDDSMAMWATAKLSGFSRVVVTARVIKSGEGQPRNGDLEGRSQPLAVGTSGLALEIDTVVAK